MALKNPGGERSGEMSADIAIESGKKGGPGGEAKDIQPKSAEQLVNELDVRIKSTEQMIERMSASYENADPEELQEIKRYLAELRNERKNIAKILDKTL